MRTWMLLAGLAVLAACSQAEDSEPAEEITQTTAAEPAPVLAADGRPAPGLYRITTADGTIFEEDVRPDGTYVQSRDGEVVETGQWEQRSPEQYCYTADAAYVDEDTSAEQECNTEQIGADGVWTSTNPDGETSTVERIEA